MADDNDEVQRARAATRGSPFLSTEQAAAYLGIGARRLKAMRQNCSGPSYRYHGRLVRYHIDDLVIWSRSRGPQGPKSGSAATGGKCDD
ncbi:helix-turn-helix domain-containing protein [Sphingopyxis sp.]|uniref:helix-turn-helix domain-containing protein n=1 Tax=Sphingopyxis sp. TaxID=1908224 RepID=UPI002FC90CCF